MHILLADDHTMFRFGIKKLLEDEFSNSKIEEVDQCSDVIKKVSAIQWDLLILDISMKGQNSLNILLDLLLLSPKLPIIILSMYSEKQFVLQAYKLGASGYLTKENAPDELISAIKKVLSGRRYMMESVAEFLMDQLTTGPGEPHERLSSREYEIFLMIAAAESVTDISKKLNISVKTVSTHRTRILEKMGLLSNAELIQYAMRQKLIM